AIRNDFIRPKENAGLLISIRSLRKSGGQLLARNRGFAKGQRKIGFHCEIYWLVGTRLPLLSRRWEIDMHVHRGQGWLDHENDEMYNDQVDEGRDVDCVTFVEFVLAVIERDTHHITPRQGGRFFGSGSGDRGRD